MGETCFGDFDTGVATLVNSIVSTAFLSMRSMPTPFAIHLPRRQSFLTAPLIRRAVLLSPHAIQGDCTPTRNRAFYLLWTSPDMYDL